MSQSVPLASDQLKILNDHDMRVMVEQSVELRHAETAAFAGVAIAATILTKIIGPNLDQDLTAILIFSLVLVVIGAVCERRARVAEATLAKAYEAFLPRNGIDRSAIVLMSRIDLQTKRADRTPIPLLFFSIGFVFAALVLGNRILIGCLHH